LLANRRIRNTKFQLFFGLFIFGLSTITMSYLLWGKLDDLLANSVSAGFSRTFGITAIPRVIVKALDETKVLNIDRELNSSQYRLIGVLIFLIIILTLTYLRSKGKGFGPNLTSFIEEESLRSIVLLFSLCMVFLSYMLISSFDYRMIYLIPLFLIGLSQDAGKKKSAITVYFAYGIPIVMWCQIFIWSSVLAQVPIILSLAIIIFHVSPIYLFDHVSSGWVKRLSRFSRLR